VSRPKLAAAKKPVRRWLPVTNGLVASFALDDCPRCDGKGWLDQGADIEQQICPCANHAFQERYSPHGDLARLKVQGGTVFYRP